MKTIMKVAAVLAVLAAFTAPKSAEAQVSVGIATPGFSLGVGPGVGYVGGGYFPGYPVVGAPIYAPRPVYVAPPVYGGFVGGIYGRPVYGRPYYGPPVYRGGYYPAPRGYYRR